MAESIVLPYFSEPFHIHPGGGPQLSVLPDVSDECCAEAVFQLNRSDDPVFLAHRQMEGVSGIRKNSLVLRYLEPVFFLNEYGIVAAGHKRKA